MVEVMYVKDEPLDKERKRAFAGEAEKVLHEELGTPPGRMRLFFWHSKLEDSRVGLIDQTEDEEQ